MDNRNKSDITVVFQWNNLIMISIGHVQINMNIINVTKLDYFSTA